MEEESYMLYQFNTIIKGSDLGRTYLFSVEIDNNFPFDINHLTAYCRSVNFSNKGKTLELQFILTKEMWEAFENLKQNSTFKINVLSRSNTILFTQSFILPIDSNKKSIVLDKFSQTFQEAEQSIPSFKVYFDL